MKYLVLFEYCKECDTYNRFNNMYQYVKADFYFSFLMCNSSNHYFDVNHYHRNIFTVVKGKGGIKRLLIRFD